MLKGPLHKGAVGTLRALVLSLAWALCVQVSAESICVPDASSSGWRCHEEGAVPPPEPSVLEQVNERVPNPEPSTNLDPLTGLSTDPADWYVPTPPRAVASTHNLSQPLAERYYRPTPGLEYCSGQYEVRPYPYSRDADNGAFPLVAEADSLTAVIDQDATLTGNVTVEQGNRRILAPSARIDEQTRQAEFPDGLLLDQPGLVLQGGQASLDLDSRQTDLTDVEFLLTDASLRGEAISMAQNPQGDLRLVDNTFTRCEPGNNGWRMSTGSLLIEEGEVFGTARNAVVRLKGVPIFYTPYLKFPVTDDRQSGFLFPNMSYSDEDGVDVSIPYYWNIAPNYDATIIPRWISQRGIGLESEFRHLSSWQETTVAGAFLPEDDLFNGTLDREDYNDDGGFPVLGPFEPADRWLGSVVHQGFLGNFRTFVDYNAASDRDYFRDLGSDLAVSSQRQLERTGGIRYAQGGFSARLWAQRFQRLDEVTVEEYQRLPELEMSYGATLLGPLRASVGLKWSEFDRDTDGLSGLNAITGSRLHAEPRLLLPFSWPYGFLRAGAGYRYTAYDLENDATALSDDNPERGIGVGFVDGGLFFERDLNWFGQNLIQTLEPRVYALWQEFADQSQLPRFDATELTFGYGQLFRENRFSGLDRIGDAKQVSGGLTTRFIAADTGREYFRASIGQIYYFDDREVTLGGSPQDEARRTGSDLAGEVSALIAGNWRVFGSVVWDPYDNDFAEGGAGIGYRRDNQHIFNLGYRNRVRDDVEQWDVSLYWPIGKRFAILGRWNWDVVSERTI